MNRRLSLYVEPQVKLICGMKFFINQIVNYAELEFKGDLNFVIKKKDVPTD